MQKTRLGITVGLLGAVMYFAGFFSGYLVAIVLAGYILLFEQNIWLRKTCVKAIALMFTFSLLSAAIGLIPEVIGFVDNICNIFNETFNIEIVSKLITFINSALTIAEKVLFIFLGYKAFNQGSMAIPVIDPLIEKHMG